MCGNFQIGQLWPRNACVIGHMALGPFSVGGARPRGENVSRLHPRISHSAKMTYEEQVQDLANPACRTSHLDRLSYSSGKDENYYLSLAFGFVKRGEFGSNRTGQLILPAMFISLSAISA